MSAAVPVSIASGDDFFGSMTLNKPSANIDVVNIAGPAGMKSTSAPANVLSSSSKDTFSMDSFADLPSPGKVIPIIGSSMAKVTTSATTTVRAGVTADPFGYDQPIITTLAPKPVPVAFSLNVGLGVVKKTIVVDPFAMDSGFSARSNVGPAKSILSADPFAG